MKLYFLKPALISLICIQMLTNPCLFAADDSNRWGQSTNTSNNLGWNSPPHSSTNQENLSEVERLKKNIGDFLNQGENNAPKPAPHFQDEPKTDILEKNGAFYILADLPGVKKDQINIEVNGLQVMISGDRKVDDEFKISNLYKVERKYGSFQRVYTLPEEIFAEQISAKYENGVLQIRLPRKKAIPAIKSKTIAIA